MLTGLREAILMLIVAIIVITVLVTWAVIKW